MKVNTNGAVIREDGTLADLHTMEHSMTTYADNWHKSVNLIQGRIKRLRAHIRALENDHKVKGNEQIHSIEIEIARQVHLLDQFKQAKADKVKDGSFTSELGSS